VWRLKSVGRRGKIFRRKSSDRRTTIRHRTKMYLTSTLSPIPVLSLYPLSLWLNSCWRNLSSSLNKYRPFTYDLPSADLFQGASYPSRPFVDQQVHTTPSTCNICGSPHNFNVEAQELDMRMESLPSSITTLSWTDAMFVLLRITQVWLDRQTRFSRMFFIPTLPKFKHIAAWDINKL
jgi:hypothetical protein